jgi:hypothetical protein
MCISIFSTSCWISSTILDESKDQVLKLSIARRQYDEIIK